MANITAASRRGRDQRLGRIFPKMPKTAWGGDKWGWRLLGKVASRRGRDQRLGNKIPKMHKPALGGDKWGGVY